MNPPTPRRRVALLPLMLLALLLISALSVGLIGFGIADADFGPIHVTINGVEQAHTLDLASLPPMHKVALVLVAACALLVALFAVPMVLLVVAGIVLLALLAGLGLPLMLALALVAVVLSPLLVAGLLLWWAVRWLRRRSIARAGKQTTIGA